MTPDQLLDELHYLATLEHALVVDHLQIYYALGTDVEIGAPGGEPSEAGRDAAGVSFSIAVNEMRHLRAVNRVLALAGRQPTVERASHVVPASGPAIPVGSVIPAQFDKFAEREHSIASTVDGRYASLASALPSMTPPLSEEVVGELSFVLQFNAEHTTGVAPLVEGLAGMVPSRYLRATRVQPADDLERRLFRLSDRYYGALLAILDARFSHEQQVGGELFGRAQTAMTELDECNKVLVARGLIPRFA